MTAGRCLLAPNVELLGRHAENPPNKSTLGPGVSS